MKKHNLLIVFIWQQKYYIIHRHIIMISLH